MIIILSYGLQNATSYELAASTPGELPLFGANALYGQCQYLVAVSIILYTLCTCTMSCILSAMAPFNISFLKLI